MQRCIHTYLLSGAGADAGSTADFATKTPSLTNALMMEGLLFALAECQNVHRRRRTCLWSSVFALYCRLICRLNLARTKPLSKPLWTGLLCFVSFQYVNEQSRPEESPRLSGRCSKEERRHDILVAAVRAASAEAIAPVAESLCNFLQQTHLDGQAQGNDAFFVQASADHI